MNQWLNKKVGNVRAQHAHSIIEDIYNGKPCLRFHLMEGDKWGSQCKCEIASRDPYPLRLKQAFEFEYSFIVPEIQPDEWNLIWQLHAPDDMKANPNLGLYMLGNRIELRVKAVDKKGAQKVLSSVIVTPGIEQTFRIQYRGHHAAKGWVNAWFNGQRIVAYEGATAYCDKCSPYLCFGQYVDSEKWGSVKHRILYVIKSSVKEI